ncbi:hypothetical protein [uncultured Caulobacter sp.]|uniref:hypothetical protein n=1 Tax=uncultured Caulobacter sp. TaxID=158749 RepID=UPI0026199367|nr:hypothetical protein [uncultured Caulobacter sp.]
MARVAYALLAVGLLAAAPALAQTGPIGAAGRWTIDLKASRFNEALTGPAPTAAEVDITKDDGKSLAWTLIEEDEAGLAALQFADAPLDGTPVKAVVNTQIVEITVRREGRNAITAVTTNKTGRKQSMRVWLSDPDTLRVEQDVDGIPGPPDQSLTFRRVR